MKNLHVKLLAVLLSLLGLGLCYYKTTRLGLPLLPSTQADVWTVEARIQLKPKPKTPLRVDFPIPRSPLGYTVVSEDFISGKFGLTTADDGENRRALWTRRSARADQVLYYRLQLSRDPLPQSVAPQDSPPPRRAEIPESIRPAVKQLLQEAKAKSADSASLAGELLDRLNAAASEETAGLLRKDTATPQEWAAQAVALLNWGKVPARLAHVLELKDGARHGGLLPWLEVYDQGVWRAFDPASGQAGLPENALIWRSGDLAPVEIEGGQPVKIDYSVTRHSQALIGVAQQRARQAGSRVMDFSLFSLPVQTQNVYRVLLMVPVGALLIVLMRNVVGFKSFGTFMPILIALAFRETGLAWGVVLFSLLVALGLLLRFYLEYLKLLLVPRLAAVLTIVILLMVAVSLLSHKLGLHTGLAVALFPMVILAMTIERMSLVWEEHGPAEALQQGLGSLLVAALGYQVMSDEVLTHLVFVFPELLLAVLAAMLLLGRYTGYRLTELWRFRAALKG